MTDGTTPWSLLFESLRTKDRETAHAAAASLLDDPKQAAEATSLALHLFALLAFQAGHRTEAEAALTRAADIERAAGYPTCAQHSLHALALFTNVDGDVSRVRAYYRQTAKHLESMRNFAGLGHCLRSLGLMAVAAGAFEPARTIWRRSVQCMQRAEPDEAGLITAWIVIEQSAMAEYPE